MAEGGSSPLRDPGGLHVYNMNGSSHKMAELVLSENPGGHGSGLNCGHVGSSLDMFPENQNAVTFAGETSIHQSTHGPQYISVDPLSYPEAGIYEELKRPVSQMQPLSHYYNNMDSGPSGSNMFEYSSSSESYKTDSSSIPGYVDMLGNSDTIMNIKREKLDYNESLGLVNSSHPSDIPYPPNTCVPDWNFYHPVSGNNNFPSQVNQSATYGYPGQPNQQYPSNMMFPNTQPVQQASFQSNDDIHFQSKKITQTILNSDWGPETIYKSHMYTGLAMEPSSRKRRAETDRPKNAKSRRKKSSSDLGGHSKTVASILLSQNCSSMQATINQSSTFEETLDGTQILDGTGRNTLVSTLMDNIRSTVQFESFCLSFPRSDAKENGFRHKVQATADMIQNINTQDVKSQPFPSNFLMGASKVISNFRNALKNTTNNCVLETDDEKNCLENRNRNVDQVEEHLPHSMVWVVKMGDRSLTANWEGQIVVGINPVQKIMSISVFQFQPNFSAEGIKCLQQTKLTKDLAEDITQNMEQFEVSRQLRCDINLKKVNQLYLYKPNGEQNQGCLILELTENPQFYQRWLHTSAEEKNKWRQRQNFFVKSAETDQNEILYIGGLVSELNEIVALVLASDHDFEAVYETGVCKSFSPDVTASSHKNHDNKGNNSLSKPDRNSNQRKSVKNKRHSRKLGSNVNKLRKEIVEVLVHHNIVEPDDVEKIVLNACLKGEKDESICEACLGIKLDESICSCFQDYINYSCDSATDLNAWLETGLKPRAYGFYENDFNMSKVPEENIDKMKIGELISSRCSEIVYYSFCNKEVGQLGYDRHCAKCHICRTMKFWHCETCDQCTESRSVCEYCGHLRNDQSRCVIKPLSVFRSQVLSARVVSLDDIKQEWLRSLEQPDDDLVTLNEPKGDTNSDDILDYNSQNAMVDQLGLLNPVGFLLGQPVAGASRKHRRYKGGQLNDIVPQPRKGGQSIGSGCTVQ